MTAIELEHIYKAYDSAPVLRGLNLRIEQGEIYGLLGPNGAGKSTIMHLLLGFLKPNSGRLRVLGTRDLARNLGRVGYVSERLHYPLRFTAREYVRFLGQLDDLREPALSQRVTSELAMVGLSEAADRPMATYSRGMLQRVGIAQALLHDPALLLIDEPTGGLDPQGQRDMLALLTGMRQRGCSVLLATHYLNEIEQVCDRVGILYEGQIAAEYPVAALRGPGYEVHITVDALPEITAERLRQLASAVRIEQHEIIIEPNTQPLQARVLRVLLEAEVAIIKLESRIRPLAALYSRVTNGEPFDDIVPNPQSSAPALAADSLPNGLFAPPGHPDAVPVAANDPLLNELLNRTDGER